MTQKELKVKIGLLVLLLLAIYASSSRYYDVPVLNFQPKKDTSGPKPPGGGGGTGPQYISGIITTDVAAFSFS